MASQHSDANRLVAYRLPRDLVINVKAEIARTGEMEKAFVAAALQAELDRRINRGDTMSIHITFDQGDQPVLPGFRPTSAGEVRKVSVFVRDGAPWHPDAGNGWQWVSDGGCSDEWLVAHPDYGTGRLDETDLRAGRQYVGPGDAAPIRFVTWTRDGEVLRDVIEEVSA